MMYNGFAGQERHQRAIEVLSLVGLDKRLDHTPNQLSGGQQQRVAIARALVNRPSLILADEPTGNLDSATSNEIMALFQQLNTEQGITIILVTHEADIAAYAQAADYLSRRSGDFRSGQRTSDREGGALMQAWLMTLRIALRALARNKLRAFLTMLGIIIGVGAVIAMVAIGEGAKSTIRAQIAALGTNVLIVLPGSNVQGGVRAGFGNVNTLVDSDARAMARELPSVAFASPVLRRQDQLVAGNLNWGTLAQGVAPEFQQIRDWQIGRGPFSSRRRHGQRRQSRRHRPNRGAPTFRQRRCPRCGHPHPQHPVPCRRRTRRAKDRRARARIKTTRS